MAVEDMERERELFKETKILKCTYTRHAFDMEAMDIARSAEAKLSFTVIKN